jgi:hypothetical protein
MKVNPAKFEEMMSDLRTGYPTHKKTAPIGRLVLDHELVSDWQPTHRYFVVPQAEVRVKPIPVSRHLMRLAYPTLATNT